MHQLARESWPVGPSKFTALEKSSTWPSSSSTHDQPHLGQPQAGPHNALHGLCLRHQRISCSLRFRSIGLPQLYTPAPQVPPTLALVAATSFWPPVRLPLLLGLCLAMSAAATTARAATSRNRLIFTLQADAICQPPEIELAVSSMQNTPPAARSTVLQPGLAELISDLIIVLLASVVFDLLDSWTCH